MSSEEEILSEIEGQYSDSVQEFDEDEEVLGLGSDDDIQAAYRKIPALRKKIGVSLEEDDDNFDEDEEDESAAVQNWGSKKSAYYDDDLEEIATDDDEGQEDENEFNEEVSRIEAKRNKIMTEDDFIDGFSAKAKVTKKDDAIAPIPDLSEWNAEDIEKDVEDSSREITELMSDFKLKIAECLKLAEALKGKKEETSEGMTFLHLKNQLQLSYLINLSYFFYLKSSGVSVKNHEVVKNLVALRLYMEKCKPIEAKLSSEISKLVNQSESNNESTSLRPDVSAFMSDDDKEDEAEEDQVYKAPKIAPMHFEEMDKKVSAKRDKKDLHKKAIMDDFMEEFDEAPDEVFDAGNVSLKVNRPSKLMEQRNKTEEEMMVRLPFTKKDKKKLKEQRGFKNELDVIHDIGRNIEEPEEDMVLEEDDFYESIKKDREDKKIAKMNAKRSFEEVNFEEEEEELVGKRLINYDIMKNKGLTPKRKKEDRNPRVKRRNKYEKSMIKLKSFKKVVQSNDKPYAGEQTGIKKHLARSVKL